jgi:hypothetical protein
MSDKTSKTDTTWMADPERVAEAMRATTLDTIDGLTALQTELRKSMETNVSNLRTESDKIVAAANKAFEEALSASFDASRKAMGYYRDQIERFGRPQA